MSHVVYHMTEPLAVSNHTSIAMQNQKLSKSSPLGQYVRKAVDYFTPSRDQYTQFIDILNKFFDEGLDPNNAASKVSMYLTYITHLPTGNEKGTFLAMDLGGTSMRIAKITLLGEGKFDMETFSEQIPAEMKVAKHSSEFFDWIAIRVKNFLVKQGLNNCSNIKLGFTFSWPTRLESIDKAYLISWTKGFDMPDAIGQDVVQLLQDALIRQNLQVKVKALTNDSVGTFLTMRYTAQSGLISVIFGTGTNGAFMEASSNILKLPKSMQTSEGSMCINSEWCSAPIQEAIPLYDESTGIDIDLKLHQATSNSPNMLEKRISGLYIGELFRMSLIYLLRQINKPVPVKIQKVFSVSAKVPSDVEACVSDDFEDFLSSEEYSKVVNVLKEQAGVEDEEILQNTDLVVGIVMITKAFGIRAIKLSALSIVSVINRIRKSTSLTMTNTENKLVIGMDGSLSKFYHRFAERLKSEITNYANLTDADELQLVQVENGSVLGAALAAAVS